ncbi:MAG TPA: hypothetical protein VIK89_10545 [Cytophagaceae bacterium]
MKKILLLIFLILTLKIQAQINVKINNFTDKTIQLKITSGEPISPTESFVEVYSQTVIGNFTSSEYIKVKDVKKDKKIYVTGFVDGLGNFKFDERVISKKNQQIELNLTLNVNTIPTDELSYQELINQLNYTPPKGSEKILSADVAYKTFFGGLSLRKNGEEIDRIEPTVLKAEISPIQFGSLNRTIEVFFSGNFISDNKGTAPGIASVNLNVSRDELYKLKYTLNDIGTQVWSGPNGKSINALFNEMSEIDKISLVKRYLRDTTLQLFQYDHMYLFKSMTLNVDKYKRTSTTIEANVPVFFSSGTAFKKEDGENFSTNAYATVLNIWATKDVTHLLVQATKEYLEKQKVIIANSTTNRDAQNIVNALDLKQDDNSLLMISDNMTKSQIETEFLRKINLLKDKQSIIEGNQ